MRLKMKNTEKQPFKDVLENKCSQKIALFTEKRPVLESLLKKVSGIETCNFIAKRLQNR